MKKYILLISATMVMISCSMIKKTEYKSVKEQDVPERYVKDFKNRHAEVKEVNWEMADTNTYYANYTSDNGNHCIMKFTRTSTGMYYEVPKEYIPTTITDYVKDNYTDYKIKKAYLADLRNTKCYEIHVANKADKKKLQFDLRGNFNKVIE